MRHLKSFGIFSLTAFFISSCIRFKEKEQVFPDIPYDEVHEIRVYEDGEKIIQNKEDVAIILNAFRDSANFFYGELVKRQVNERELTLDLVAIGDTLTLEVYSTEQSQKLEIGFLDAYDINQPDKFRRYNRFYINKNVLNLIRNNRKRGE
ncbi:hypothetical protein [Poritiphilus flavus]|uniref:Lipoprotein n=1 Tax=Poritiphilus flavus TaxID=2697053 RepID=A0A6L9EDY5_9FLAO|nr:hypothetical protein [Poritiphilus flavus]NAS12907.1 hypothetical protein [Poritiphilus flavus]